MGSVVEEEDSDDAVVALDNDATLRFVLDVME